MGEDTVYTLPKRERLYGLKLISRLFAGGEAFSMTVYPLRAVCLEVERAADEPAARMLVSVSKRHFKHAVDRNRAKRLVREAYRLHKHILLDVLAQKPDRALLVAFVWQEGRLHDARFVEQRMVKLLHKLSERL